MSRALEFLRPSGAATWVVCFGYVAMRAAYPEQPEEADHEVREDGTAAHWLASEIWEGRYPAVDSYSPNHRVLDDFMFDAVDEYHNVLRSWPVGEVYVERSVDCSVIYAGMKGTPDAWAYDPVTRTLYIADFKYGFRFVEVWENWQLICYVAALIALLFPNDAGLHDQTITVEMVIVQPRSNHRDGPIRKWRVKASDLRAYINKLIHAAEMAMRPDPQCTPNPGCGDCAGRHACMALQNSALAALETSYSGLPLELSAAAAGDELRRLKEAEKRIEARITGLEAQVESMIRKGTVVPHWSLVPTFARESWIEGAESQVMTLATYYNASVVKPPKLATPNQVRKLLPASLVAPFVHKPSTGVKLAKQDPYEAKKKFSTTE